MGWGVAGVRGYVSSSARGGGCRFVSLLRPSRPQDLPATAGVTYLDRRRDHDFGSLVPPRRHVEGTTKES